jgi:hypothetical protein
MIKTAIAFKYQLINPDFKVLVNYKQSEYHNFKGHIVGIEFNTYDKNEAGSFSARVQLEDFFEDDTNKGLHSFAFDKLLAIE